MPDTPARTRIPVARWLPAPGRAPAQHDVVLDCTETGITVSPGGDAAAGAGLLAMPAPVNAHDHGYGVRPLDFGAPDDALEPWIPGLRLRPATDTELEATVAFGRMALAGCAATVHCHNSLNADNLVREAAAVVRAARTVGLRLALSCPLLDDSPHVYGGLERAADTLDPDARAWLAARTPVYAPPHEQIAAVDAVAAEHAGAGVDVQYGPIGPQWCSDAMLEAIAEASERNDRRVHMHLLESPRQRDWLDRRFPGGVVKHLDRIGFLSPRLAVAHGVQLRPDEVALLGERGVQLVSNPSANLRLRSGILPSHCPQDAAIDCAVGLDGTGFDDAQDIWQELRLFRLLHNGTGLDAQLPAHRVFDALTRVGADVTNHAPGADTVVVDWSALTADAIFPDDAPEERLLARMSAGAVRDLVVGGRHVVRSGALTGLDFAAARAELAGQAAADARRLAALKCEARGLAALVRRHYAELGRT